MFDLTNHFETIQATEMVLFRR